MRVLLYLVGVLLALAGIGVAAFLAFGKGTALIGLSYDAAAILFAGGFIVIGLAAVVGTISDAADDADYDAPGPMVDPRVTAGGVGLAAGTAIGTQFDKAAQGVDTAIDKVSEAADAAKQKAADTATDAADKTADAAKAVGDAVADKADDAKDATIAAADAVADTASDTVDAAKDKVSDVVEAASAPDTAPESAPEQAPEVETQPAAEPQPEAEKQPPADLQPEPEAEPEAEQAQADAAPDEDELYVVEELVIRGKQARVLSDNTVEAETNEGWMRFENTEHLEEYLDAMGG